MKSFWISRSLGLTARLSLLYLFCSRLLPARKSSAFSSTENYGWQTPDLNLFPCWEVWIQKSNSKIVSFSPCYSWTGYFYHHTFLNKSWHLILLSETCKSKEVEVLLLYWNRGLWRVLQNGEKQRQLLTSTQVANNRYIFFFEQTLNSSLWSIHYDMKLFRRGKGDICCCCSLTLSASSGVEYALRCRQLHGTV